MHHSNDRAHVFRRILSVGPGFSSSPMGNFLTRLFTIGSTNNHPRREDSITHTVARAGTIVSGPNLVYGTAWKGIHTADLVYTALTQGFRRFDTAGQPKHYNEVGVGDGIARWISQSKSFGSGSETLKTADSVKTDLEPGPTEIPHLRSELFLQTKYTPRSGQDVLGPLPYDLNDSLAKQVAQSFAMSQRHLRSNYIDSFILHSPLSSRTDLCQVWQAMEELVHDNKVGQIGISNCHDLSLLIWLYKQANVKPAVVQNRFVAMTGYDREIRHFCLDHEIRYEAFWTLTGNPHILKSPTLLSLARKYQRTPEAVFFRVLMQLGITPLTGTSNEQHMRDDLDALLFQLDDDEVMLVDQLMR